MTSIYDKVIGSAFDGKPDPTQSLALSWSANADSTAWTYKLRDGVLFSNGDKLTSADVKALLEFSIAEGSKSGKSGPLRASIGTLDTPDELTLVVNLKGADIFWPLSYTSIIGSGSKPTLVWNSKVFSSVGLETYNKNPVGSGPYTFKSLSGSDRIVMEAKDKHWLFGVPRTKTVTFFQVPEESTRTAQIRTGQADMASIGTGAVKTLTGVTGLRFVNQEDTYVGNYLIREQFVEEYPGYGKNPFNSKAVRQAIHYYAIDREAIVDNFLVGLGKPTMNYPISPLEVAYYGQDPLTPADPAKAKKMIADAGWPNGFTLDMIIFTPAYTPEGGEIMEAMAVMLEQVGLKVNRVPLAPTTWRTETFANIPPKVIYDRPTLVGMYWFFSGLTTTSFAGTVHSPNSPWRMNFDPEGDRLANAWITSKTLDDYKANGKAYQQWEYDNITTFEPIFINGPIWVVNQKVPTKFSLGLDSTSFKLEYAAAMR